MNILKKIFLSKITLMDKYNQFTIDFVCPNSSPWKSLHCIYRLRPLEDSSEELWVALPSEDCIWNFMCFHSNNKLPFEFPFSSTEFRKKEDILQAYSSKYFIAYT